MGTKYLAIKRIPIKVLIIQLDRKRQMAVWQGQLVFEVYTVCLSISVSIMRCSSCSSHKFEAETVKIVRGTLHHRGGEWCYGCVMKQELHLVLWGCSVWPAFTASSPEASLKTSYGWLQHDVLTLFSILPSDCTQKSVLVQWRFGCLPIPCSVLEWNALLDKGSHNWGSPVLYLHHG